MPVCLSMRVWICVCSFQFLFSAFSIFLLLNYFSFSDNVNRTHCFSEKLRE